MVDLTTRWPLGLGTKRWWLAPAALLALLALAVTFDAQLSRWAQSWGEGIHDLLEQITRYGESDWILYPALALLAVTALVALFVRWKLMRTILLQFTALYGFILVGVGVPSLTATLLKILVGRARPMHLDQLGVLSFQMNWGDWSLQGFPSGHATTAFGLAMVIAFLSPRWFYAGFVFAAAIGVSRVALGVHFPSDVLAGAVLGVMGAYVFRWIFARQRWMFEFTRDGRIVPRPMSSLKRYLRLKQRDTAPKPQTSRP